ncbi:MAG: hypothetical protein GXP39_06120 [Chloroflexi bacterium]|nr:hypothetical protein [Chloroflexota bacterium]
MPVDRDAMFRGLVACFVLAAVLIVPITVGTPMAEAVGACGDIVINEVKFKQTSTNDPNYIGEDEWVELFVVRAIDEPTTITVDDLETSTSGRFRLTFTVNSASANSYIIVHDNESASTSEPLPPQATDVQEFFGAGTDAGLHLNDSGDNIVLLIEGQACEEVHWGTRGSGSNSNPNPPAIVYAFGSTTNIGAGESIQRSPNGTGGNWYQAGTGAPEVGYPTTMGFDNNAGVATAVILQSLSAHSGNGAWAYPLVGIAFALTLAVAGRRRC